MKKIRSSKAIVKSDMNVLLDTYTVVILCPMNFLQLL